MKETLTFNANRIRVVKDDESDDYVYGDISQVEFIIEDGKNEVSSHYFCSHWIIATIKTSLKLRDLKNFL